MTNYLQPGESVTYTAPAGGVTSGVPVQIGQIVVIPAVTADAGDRFVGHLVGVFSVPKTASQAWTEGAVVYWDDEAGEFTTSAAGNLEAGAAVEAVGGGADETTGIVRLDGIGRVQEDT